MSDYFQHHLALVESGAKIGKRTRIWAFSHVLSGAEIGEDCNICDQTFIENDVRVGNRVTIKCGVSLWAGISVEEDVFVGPNAVFTNDKRPRSRKQPPVYGRTLLKQGCSIGANATVLPGITIGRWAMVGAGAVVTNDVPDFALVVGTPARQVGWVCRCGEKLAEGIAGLLECACGCKFRRLSERVCEAALVTRPGTAEFGK